MNFKPKIELFFAFTKRYQSAKTLNTSITLKHVRTGKNQAFKHVIRTYSNEQSWTKSLIARGSVAEQARSKVPSKY